MRGIVAVAVEQGEGEPFTQCAVDRRRSAPSTPDVEFPTEGREVRDHEEEGRRGIRHAGNSRPPPDSEPTRLDWTWRQVGALCPLPYYVRGERTNGSAATL
jgi:hypothetical protein